MDLKNDRMVTVRFVAGKLNCQTEFAYELIRDGRLKAYRIGSAPCGFR